MNPLTGPQELELAIESLDELISEDALMEIGRFKLDSDEDGVDVLLTALEERIRNRVERKREQLEEERRRGREEDIA